MNWKDIRNRTSVYVAMAEDGFWPDNIPSTSEPPKSIFDNITLRDARYWINVGNKTIRELEEWLGHKFPLERPLTKEVKDAIELLRSHGYRIAK